MHKPLRLEADCSMEIITGVERHRRWRLEEKRRIIAKLEQCGASFADVLCRPGANCGLLWNGRR